MKKLLALIFVALCTISIEAQEKYVAIERNAETGAYTLSKEFKAVLPLNEDGTYGDVATNKDSRGSVVVMKTASVTVEAVGGSIPAQVPDVAGDNTATHVDINPDGTVNSWDDIKWQQKSQGDINWAWIQGTGTPAAKIEAEAIMTDDVPATYVDENGVEHTKYRPVYTLYNPDGSLGVPEVGLYYKVTATKNGSIKIGVWVNKGNRNTYVVDAATALPVAYKAMGYINGQNETYLQGDGTEASRKKYLTAEEIESIHKAAKVNAETGEDSAPYVIGAGNQPFFGNIAFNMEAGKTYYVFCESSQIGFNGWQFGEYITFTDSKVKEICVANWDTNSDGELGYAEAAAVTSLANYFSNNTEITSFNELQYFTRLTTISSSAFNGCSNLASITIPNSVTKGNGAFSGCSALTSVTVGNSTPIKLTDVSTFSNRANATLYVPAGSKAAYAAASIWNEFKEIIEIENITFADSKVKEICVANWDTNGDGELSNAEAAAVTSLGEIFKGNTEIKAFNELQYFVGINEINKYAFSGCTNLESVVLPKNVTTLSPRIFEQCDKLRELHIPASVTSINDAIIRGADGIEQLTVDENNPVFDSRNNCNAVIETKTNTLIVGCNTSVIPNGIEAIGVKAFRDMTKLFSVIIPNSVTTIGDNAFDGCDRLTSVTVGNKTPFTISESVFSNCSNATLYVPAGSKAAYEEASVWKEFKEIIEIENITFADSKVKEICVANWDTNGDGELSYAEAAAVTSLGKIFEGNTEIVSFDELQYFTGLTSINEYAFQDCSNLSSLKIPNSVTSLGVACFSGCWKLQTLTIPNSVTTLNDKIFYDCGIKSITIPQSVKSIGISLFKNCPDLTTIIVEEGNPIYDSRDNCNAIIETSSNTLIASCKNTVIPQTVTTIGEAAFMYCSGLTSIVVPNNVLSIKGAAFRDCFDLTSVTLPNTITNIDTLTFWGCHVLESIIIPKSVKSIGDYAFGRCLQLKSVVIPSSTTTISSNAFEYCSELTSVTVGNSEPISISNFTNRTNATLYVPAGSKAAYEASSIWNEFKEIIEIENITFADSKVKEICVANWDTNGDGELSYAEAAVSSIGKTFKDNKAITSFDELQYFTGVDTIKASAFSGCNSLVSVTLPNTVKEIQQNAFYSTSLESIKIPASVNTIEAAAFNSCSNIKSIVVEERNAVYDSRNNCNGIVETATNTLIVGCMNTIIPDDITSIGESVFRGNDSLKQIVIPNSVTSIGKDAFYRCSALTSVTVGNSTPVELIDGNTFSNRANATLYVPAGSKEAYEAASVWNRFKEIVPIATVTINKYGSGTYCSPYALDFTNVSGMKAYVAAGYNTTTNTVYMLSVKTAQPGEGLFIKGAPGDYVVPEIETSTDNYLNLLVGTTNEVTVNTLSDDEKYTNYAYSLNKGTDVPAFYKYSDGSKCKAYKAYLQIPTSWLPTVSEAKTVNLVFDDEEPTGIEEFRTEKDVDDVKIYDMQGRRVTKPGKGLYIVNGKKVVFK